MQIKVFNIRLDKENFEKDQIEINKFLETVTFKKSSVNFIESKIHYWSILIHYENQETDNIKKIDETKTSLDDLIFTDKEKEIIAYFKQWRLEKSRDNNLPAFAILTNKTIYDIAKRNPKTLEDLDTITGIGKNKKNKYGDDIIALLNSI